MNKTSVEAVSYLRELAQLVQGSTTALDLCVFPPFTALPGSAAALRGAVTGGVRLALGAQNMHWDESGAWTGEISPRMLLEFGVRYVELGHWERRQHFGETDEQVNQKVRAAVKHGLVPVVCVGESRRDRDAGATADVVSRQVRSALHRIPDGDLDVVIAYEPGWAIGVHGSQAPAADVAAVHVVIRDVLDRVLRRTGEVHCRVVFGGSVGPENAESYGQQEAVGGLFVGRAGLEPVGFLEVVRRFVEARSSGELGPGRPGTAGQGVTSG